jgi:hypothetical protein
MASSSHRARARLRTTPLAIVTGLAAAVLMALTMTGTLSAFSASITNSSNTTSSGTLLMREVGTPGATCYSNGTSTGSASTNGNSAACSTINKFGGGTLKPGEARSTTVTIWNDGTIAAAGFTLAPTAACAPGTAGTTSGTATDICGKIAVTIVSGTTPVFNGTLKTLGESAAMTLPAVASTKSADFTFTVTLDAGVSNDYQGLTASVPLKWTFTA